MGFWFDFYSVGVSLLASFCWFTGWVCIGVIVALALLKFSL
jgi:hypothetical protein